MQTIEIKGVSNSTVLAEYIDSNMIDIVYIDQISTDGKVITLLLEEEINLHNPDDRQWLSELLNKALSVCNEGNAKYYFTN